jgi:hypothetical protein
MMVDVNEELHGVRTKLEFLVCTVGSTAFAEFGYDENIFAVCLSIPMASCISEFGNLNEWKA